MTRIESVEEGAHGIVRLTLSGGSLFRFRAEYWDGPFLAGAEADEAALEAAAACQLAEDKALSLLSRAEQYRLGMERKLQARKLGTRAIAAALDRLERLGLLSDERYAHAWMLQRCRGRAEGPASLRASLMGKGVERRAIDAALRRLLEEEGAPALIDSALKRIALPGALDSKEGIEEARMALKRLGWKTGDIDEALDIRSLG